MLSIVSTKPNIAIDRGIRAPGHGEGKVDSQIGIDKYLLGETMLRLVNPGEENNSYKMRDSEKHNNVDKSDSADNANADKDKENIPSSLNPGADDTVIEKIDVKVKTSVDKKNFKLAL